MSEPRKEYRIEGRDSTIFRVQKNPDNPYVMIDTRPITNKKLSYRAKGVLTYLLSRPDGWEINIGDLVNHGTEGRDALRNTLNELRDAGHLVYQQSREAGKFSTGNILVYEVPRTENPYTGKPDTVNPTQVLIKLNSNEYSKRDTDFQDVLSALSTLSGGAVNTSTAQTIDGWLERHPVERILQAVSIARDKGARSAGYVDKILVGWEANGYPKTRDQKVNDAKKKDPKRAAYEKLKRMADNGE